MHKHWQVGPKAHVGKAFDLVVKTCELEYPKAAPCL
jgi:hypothetical protein